MATSTRFAVAIHILSLLARKRPSLATSEELAASIGTNPAVVRRLLTQLAAAGITDSRLGKGGGAGLARPPKKITLLDVYGAVETPGIIALHRSVPNSNCPVGRHILDTLADSIAPAEKAFFDALGDVNLKQFAKSFKT